jgi:hypothetical protein
MVVFLNPISPTAPARANGSDDADTPTAKAV